MANMLPGLGSGELVLTSAFVAYETSFNFSQFLPSIMTIRSFVDSNEKLEAIRQGEIIAAVYSGGFAALFSYILKSPLPVALAALAIAATIVVYEWALRGSPIYCAKPIAGSQTMVGESGESERVSQSHSHTGDYGL
jgi:hypothetical protein